MVPILQRVLSSAFMKWMAVVVVVLLVAAVASLGWYTIGLSRDNNSLNERVSDLEDSLVAQSASVSTLETQLSSVGTDVDEVTQTIGDLCGLAATPAPTVYGPTLLDLQGTNYVYSPLSLAQMDRVVFSWSGSGGEFCWEIFDPNGCDVLNSTSGCGSGGNGGFVAAIGGTYKFYFYGNTTTATPTITLSTTVYHACPLVAGQ